MEERRWVDEDGVDNKVMLSDQDHVDSQNSYSNDCLNMETQESTTSDNKDKWNGASKMKKKALHKRVY